ncbi:M48 family metallopeptidase [Aquamicrobium sp. LC103]|uniref:M48 family metallopeptidase n=1 Tax=Aquamicrobium sp. LC103 TaxID=1120658 RepID=UPI00069B709D|nr:M48 family metallopeptidase [Aquamicrobium sp. LC103]TKT80304.1 M48 family metallopeptidase [Aquamicrobium sp. LC103]
MQEKVQSSVALPVQVERWPSEIPLRVAIILTSIALWLLIIVGTFGLGLIYVVLIAAFLFFVQVGFIAHLRGSAIRLGPDQFPEIHQRVVEFARRAGMKKEPEAYIMQADGALNAFATKFFRGQIVVLYADLLEACGDDQAARDMIIGHEIGHLRCGHLDWFILTAPGRIIPFLGSAYSRACEYTCDRWGVALSGGGEDARRGLVVLAAGGAHKNKVNVGAYVRQQENLDTGWMTLARWLSTYPPLSARVAAITPGLAEPYKARRGRMRALGIIAAFIGIPVIFAASMPTAIRYLERPINILAGDVEAVTETDEGGTAGSGRFASVDEMPAPKPVPQIDDARFAELATVCHGGDMAACDELYFASDYGTVEEEYGSTCAGRIDDNDLECTKLLAE